MKKETKLVIGITLLIAGLTIGIISREKNKKKIKLINDILDGKAKDPSQSGSQVIISQPEYDSLLVGQFPLKFGDKNRKVFELQKALNVSYGTNLDVDGKFGDSTAQALCDKIYKTCFTHAQARLYKVSNTDFDTIKSHRN